MDLRIRLAEHRDYTEIARVGSNVFRATYRKHNPPERMEAYLAEHYTVEAVAELLGQEDHWAHVIEEGGTVIGFVIMGPARKPPELAEQHTVELMRLYLAQQAHGRGMGRALVKAAEVEARTRGYESIWLGVFKKNEHAIGFYQRIGFEIAGTITFLFVDDPQEDYLMVKPLGLG